MTPLESWLLILGLGVVVAVVDVLLCIFGRYLGGLDLQARSHTRNRLSREGRRFGTKPRPLF